MPSFFFSVFVPSFLLLTQQKFFAFGSRLKDTVDWGRKAGEAHARKLAKFNKNLHTVNTKEELKKVCALVASNMLLDLQHFPCVHDSASRCFRFCE